MMKLPIYIVGILGLFCVCGLVFFGYSALNGDRKHTNSANIIGKTSDITRSQNINSLINETKSMKLKHAPESYSSPPTDKNETLNAR